LFSFHFAAEKSSSGAEETCLKDMYLLFQPETVITVVESDGCGISRVRAVGCDVREREAMLS
jgi:hypothetical protein